MTCSFEEEDKACGRRVGLWARQANNPLAAANAAYAQAHMVRFPGEGHER
jgi:hypothetical protein